MPITRQGIVDGVVGAEKLATSLHADRYCFETFMQEPLCTKKGELTTPGGTDLAECRIHTGRYTFEYTYLGDATDAFLPTLASEGGYNWVMTTATLDRGIELNFGGLKDGHPRHHIPSAEDWFARVLLIVDDASGVDIFFGFRKVAAYAATLTEYSDLAGIRVLGASGSSDAAITLVTNLNNAGATDYTSTASGAAGLEDATAIELEVRSVQGKAFFFVNGQEFTPVSFTYDAGDVVNNTLRLIQATDIAAQIKTLCYEAGPLRDRRAASLASLAGTTT